MDKKREYIDLIVGFIGAVLGLVGVSMLNRYLLPVMPIGLRMLFMIIGYWLIALVPLIIIFVRKESFADYGFSGENRGKQTIVGVLIGVGMSLVLILIPILAGFGKFVDSGKRYHYVWQFCYEFVYCILAVSAVEEIVFRGFIYGKLKKAGKSDLFAIVISSVLFGAYHLMAGNLLQVLVTGCIGAFLCVCRLKIKNCTTLSLIVGHGLHDALITVWAVIFLK